MTCQGMVMGVLHTLQLLGELLISCRVRGKSSGWLSTNHIFNGNVTLIARDTFGLIC